MSPSQPLPGASFGARGPAGRPQRALACRPLCIAVVTESWPPEVNGVSTTIARIVHGLEARGHGVQLVRPRQRDACACEPGASRDEWLTRGMPIPRYPQLTMGLPAKQAIARRWRERRPDVVHIATEGPLGWSALRAARELGLPVSSDFRTNFHAYCRHYGVGWLARPIMAYLRRFHNRTQATMVPTVALRDDLAAAGFARLHVVARGVDTVRFDPRRRSSALRSSWGVAEADPVVACVGRLAPEKNLGLALTAFEAIRRQRPRARLLFVGDGPMRPELESRCPSALFAGTRRDDDLAAHYASADLLLFPSLTETFGNVTTEALASALPLVAFDRAAAAQMVRSGLNGLLARAGDDQAFVDHAVRVATSPTFARHLGRCARASVMPHGWESIVAQVEAVMAEAIGLAAVEDRVVRWRALRPTAG